MITDCTLTTDLLIDLVSAYTQFIQAQKVGASFLKNWVQKNGATTLAGTEDVFTPVTCERMLEIFLWAESAIKQFHNCLESD